MVIFLGDGKHGIVLLPLNLNPLVHHPPVITILIGGMVTIPRKMGGLPSGKQPHNYGKSPFFMGKSTINGNFQ